MSLRLSEETPPAGYEKLLYAEDPSSGLRAYICIHSTKLGPAAGGCRMWRYDSIDAARDDVLRLAEGMTAKNALAGVGLGGGKSVIIGDARLDKSEALLRSFGQAVHTLAGQYYTAEDVGISTDDIRIVAQETPFAVGLDQGAFGSGDPSPFTAEGVFQCMKVGATNVFGTSDLTGRRVLVQGLGHVGMSLAETLHHAGAQLIVSDINQSLVKRAQSDFGATICAPNALFETEMDIFAPCALGGILTSASVQKLTAKLVCGAANNQLAQDGVAGELRARGIRYLPDYVVNAGGIISVASEIHKEGPAYRDARLKNISVRVGDILKRSETTELPTNTVARQLVNEILEAQQPHKDKGAA